MAYLALMIIQSWQDFTPSRLKRKLQKQARRLILRYEIYRIGGSHAQRDLFSQTLIEAALRSGRYPLARALTAERIATMPDNAPTARLRARALEGLVQ